MDYGKYLELKAAGKIDLEETGEGTDNNTRIALHSEQVVERNDRISVRMLENTKTEFMAQKAELQKKIDGITALIKDIQPMIIVPEDPKEPE